MQSFLLRGSDCGFARGSVICPKAAGGDGGGKPEVRYADMEHYHMDVLLSCRREDVEVTNGNIKPDRRRPHP